VLGAPGSGAGQFAQLTNLVPGRNGSLIAFDAIRRQATPVTADLRLGAALPLKHKPSFQLADGTFVVARQIPTPDQAGFPVHLVGSDGTVLRSFGIDVPQMRSDLRLLLERLAAPASKGGIWTVAPGRFAIERWDPRSGSRLESLPVQSTWFKESTRTAGPSLPAQPIIEAIWEADGVLWILGRDADPDWTPPAGPLLTERPFSVSDYDAKHDWVLEAIDVDAKRVIASRRFKEALWAGDLSPFVVTRRGGTGSDAHFDVSRVDLSARAIR